MGKPPPTNQPSSPASGLRTAFGPSCASTSSIPVLYVEYEDITGADKTLLEVVGHDGQADLAEPNDEAREEHEHEAELKLILSSNVKDWNISENFIAEKNLGHEPWEFGYAVGATRPLRSRASGKPCTFCLEKFIAGVEALRRPRRYRLAHPCRHVPLHRPHPRVATARAAASASLPASASRPPALIASIASAFRLKSTSSAAGSAPAKEVRK